MKIKDKFAKIRNQYRKIEKDLINPKIQAKRDKFSKLSQKEAELKKIIEKIRKFEELEREIKDTTEIIENETETEMKEIAQDELKNLKAEKNKLEKELEFELIVKDSNDEKNALLEIRAGTGGDEAELFAAEIFRMYQKYAEKKGLTVNLVNSNRTGIGGIKEVIAFIRGKNAYRYFKYEGGVHRVQRIPATEKSGRIHTSAATVVVLPEAEEVDIEIKPEDIKIDTFRSSGPGGQSVNTTDSAVLITHLPSKTTVTCQDEKSQLKNREKAMKILRSRLLQLKKEERAKKQGRKRKIMVGTGDRSEKIRTYNFPGDRVTDHRIKFTIHGVQDILKGNLDPLVNKLLEKEQKEKLKIKATE